MGQNRPSAGFAWHTLAVAAGVLLLNLGVFGPAPESNALLAALQYNGVAVQWGDWYRLLTGNLVHWNPTHFLLDIGLFLVVGVLYERAVGRAYPVLLLFLCLAVGLGLLWFTPERTLCRGLSGVNSGLLAAALVIEAKQSLKRPSRWLWVGPAAGLFVFKTIYEGVTGNAFFGADALIGPMQLSAVSHVAGAVAGGVFMVVAGSLGRVCRR